MKAFLLFGMAGSLVAQSADPRVQRLIDQVMQQRPAIASAAPPVTRTLTGVLPKAQPKVCSVPLIEMQLPEGKGFTMLQMAPQRETHDAIAVPMPAPPCEP